MTLRKFVFSRDALIGAATLMDGIKDGASGMALLEKKY